MTFLLTQLVRQSAQAYPEHPALVYEKATLTYAALEAESNRLAQRLAALGIRRGDRVGVFLPKSPRAVVALLGSMKAGAAYVPLDPNMPARRVAYILQDCGIGCLVTSGSQWRRLAAGDATLPALQLVLTDDEVVDDSLLPPAAVPWAEVRQASAAPLPVPGLTENDLAYILYTSGSTGNPKGVMLSHRAALTFVDWAHETFRVTHADRLSSHAPFHFDLSIFDLYVAFKAGATVHLLSPTLSVFPLSLAQYMAAQRLTVWYSVPSILTSLILHGQLATHDLSALRCVLFAGEVFPLKYLRQLVRLLPHPEYHNLYGPTETNVITWHHVQPADIGPDVTRPLPIGVACANSHLFALKEDGTQAAVGEEGELAARGPTLMRGYWGLPERTARSLVDHSLHPGLGAEKVYRTGDRVQVGEKGVYHFLGRVDNMVKSRGYRIELGEIETALYSHPQVAEAAVVAIPDEEISHRLAAVVVPEGQGRLTAGQIRAFIAAYLPKYMVPDVIHFVARLPQTSTGKVDRRKLLLEIEQESR